MSTTDIPQRKKKTETTSEDAWERYAQEFDKNQTPNPLEDKMEPPEVPDIDELFSFEKDEESGSIWDHPQLQGFFSFVETKLDQMHKYASTVKDVNNITFYELNEALANHYDVHTSLVGLYNTADVEREVIEMDFQAWFDEKYMDMRKKMNPTSVSAQKWSSAKEIEAAVRVEYKDEYKQRYLKVVAARRQTKFIQRLLEGWEGFKFSLQTMSKNIQTQYRDAGGEYNTAF